MIDVNNKRLVLFQQMKYCQKSFLPCIICFILFQYMICICFANPFNQLIYIMKMIIKSLPVYPTLFRNVIDCSNNNSLNANAIANFVVALLMLPDTSYLFRCVDRNWVIGGDFNIFPQFFPCIFYRHWVIFANSNHCPHSFLYFFLLNWGIFLIRNFSPKTDQY